MSELNPNFVLGQLFGDNRAEWPSANFKDLFVRPTYLGKLEVMRPCFLVGGRGTGKTTALQSLRYDSMLERIEGEGQTFADQEYLGVLVRMNKNRVRAFSGSGVGEERWSKLFAHYFNLIVCSELANLTSWLEVRLGLKLPEESLSEISNALGLDECGTLDQLKSSIKKAISSLCN
ncbi:MAG: hypothetical protein A2W44_05695 [Acinetobacter sp. RIFCSPHIGHO2_12_41_5]|nr:MAG: hypothetical protein A2W44_05695 [Acinetobacter sp. RIFCSPHIGHO2_12_41_5]